MAALGSMPMPKTDESFDPEQYAPVAERVTLFYASYPTGRILTELVSESEGRIVFKAIVFRSAQDTLPAATGWAAERVGDGDINTVACLENTETSAIGRALANLGLTASRARPSREEMEKANRARLRVVTPRNRATTHGARVAQAAERSSREEFERRQALADRLIDALDLISTAERFGLPSHRAASLREKLRAARVSTDSLERVARGLRHWLAQQTR